MPVDSSSTAYTIVIATYNAESSLQGCLESVFVQRDSAVQVVVIDGGSTDGTTALLADSDGVDYWASEPDDGVYDAWNKALARADGDWVYFLGADDRLKSPTVLEQMSGHLRQAEGSYRVVYGSVHVVDDDGHVLRRVGEPWDEARKEFGQRMTIPHQGTFHHRSLFEERGTFDARFKIAGDYEFLLREFATTKPLFIPDLVVADMAAGGVSDRPDAVLRSTTEFYRARRMHGLVRTPEWRAPELIRARVHFQVFKWMGRERADGLARAYRRIVGKGR